MQFQRTARTDKGVHAVRQVVSLKLGWQQGLEARINAHLPEDIRVFWVARVTKAFNCKNACSGRRYEYMLPTYALMHKDYRVSTDFRVSSEQVEVLRTCLGKYVGTRNYHNFTSKMAYENGSANRYITSFECSEPFERQGLEWVSLTVCGQSFVLNQIRKMVGLACAVTRGYCGMDVFERAFSSAKVEVPRAPGLGLMLDA
eukprot:UC1_evm1s950